MTTTITHRGRPKSMARVIAEETHIAGCSRSARDTVRAAGFKVAMIDAGLAGGLDYVVRRKSILAELSRFQDVHGDEATIALAQEISHQHIPVKQAIVLIREQRTGQTPCANVYGLTVTISAAIAAYFNTHANGNNGLALDALELMHRAFLEESSKIRGHEASPVNGDIPDEEVES
jgi:hypothetical protein